MPYQFPEDFLWGTATASHQVEGGNVYNDIWLLERLPGTMFVEPSGDAIDHYHNYADDINLLAGLGFNTYRFSLEWSRIEPEEGEFSKAALEHYRRMLAACREHDLMPMVTYSHMTLPRWLMRYGGWKGEKLPGLFARFCEHAARHLGDLIGAACTLNEINLPLVLEAMGVFSARSLVESPVWAAAAQALGVKPEQFAPFMFSSGSQAQSVMLAAHRRAVDAIKSGPGSYRVGVTLALPDIQAVPGGEDLAIRAQREICDVYLEALRNDDFAGVQTYTRMRFGPQGLLPPEAGVELTQMGYEFCPEALEGAIRHAVEIAGIPVIVTENGIATDDDTRRIEYIRRALDSIGRCLQAGLDVRGYLYWSAFDNFEWTSGYKMRFGLIGVDRETQRRTIKPSACFLGGIACTGVI